MTPVQLRMGRAALEFTPAELADEAKVPSTEIVRYERGGGIASEAHVAALRQVLEAAGVVFNSVDGARLATKTGK
ncbi:helix-turn-helix domain-containing protein [Belnapia moabensis]|uniref:helix-turn-helix domain-containing protein n=1 Tax=Belnapia moabensis TaxID=365533 RepID=UPI0006943B4E|nr:helix-turn-helix domain-containing protein [Belnapia moabensis]